ncbi:hypothetical protein JCM10212_003011 [Sporobolomyces blumeae]
MPVLSLPYTALQPSISNVLSDVRDPSIDISVEECWISLYYYASTSPPSYRGEHGKLRVSEGESGGEVVVEVKEGRLSVDRVHSSEFVSSCEALSIPATTLLLPSPSSNVAPPPSSSPYSSTSQETPAPSFYCPPARARSSNTTSVGLDRLAISRDGKRIVVAGRDGFASVVEVVRFEPGLDGRVSTSSSSSSTASDVKLRKGKEVSLRGHVGDITHVEFFPSSEVVLTASSDMTLRVFSALDGSCPRRLTGHTKRVTGLHILASSPPNRPRPLSASTTTTDRNRPVQDVVAQGEKPKHQGRLVLSGSMDGTVRMWDVAKGLEVKRWDVARPVSSMCVVDFETDVSREDKEKGHEDEQEQEGDRLEQDDAVRGKVAFVGHDNGTISIVHLDPSSAVSSSSASRGARLVSPSTSTSIDSISYDRATNLVVTGSRDGVCSVFRFTPHSLPSSSSPSRTEKAVEEGGQRRGIEVDQTETRFAPLVEWRRTEGSSIHQVVTSRRSRTNGRSTSTPVDHSSSSSSSGEPASDPGSTDPTLVGSVLVASSDGLPYRASIFDRGQTDADGEGGVGEGDATTRRPLSVEVEEEFVGLDCDPATSIVEDGEGRVWITGGGTDGTVRVYERTSSSTR